MQPSGSEIEREVHDGREPPLDFSGQHRALAQRRIQRRHEVGGQVVFGLGLRDRPVLRFVQAAVADGPIPSRGDVGLMRLARIGS